MAEQSTFENELPKKSTVEYVRGLDANGNPILINKSDLASVVGGLLKISQSLTSSNFFQIIGSPIQDLNTWLPNGGWQIVSYGAQNSPEGAGIVILYSYNDSNKLQIFFSMSNLNGGVGSVYYRAWHNSNGFSKWKKVTATEMSI